MDKGSPREEFMDVYEAMAARKTIRDFAGKPVSEELIHKIINAGFHAPTNNHMRDWHFILLQDKDKRKALLDQVIHPVSKSGANGILNRWGVTNQIQREMYLDGIPKQYSMLLNAGCLLLPCFHQPTPVLKSKEIFGLNAFASIWCCIENILVAAASEGLFGVTRIPFKTESQIIKQALSIPVEYEVPCWLALGYPVDDAHRARQVEIILEDRIHYGGW
jgi:nitroreductase